MGYDPFPSGRAMGSGHYLIYDNDGIIISHLQGEFKTEGKEEEYLTFRGRDVNKNGKFVVLLYEVGNFGMDEWFGLYIERKVRNF